MSQAPSLVDETRLEIEFPRLRAAFEAAKPFRHVIIDDFLDRAFAERLHASYPGLDVVQRSIARVLRARSYDGEFARFGAPFSDYFSVIGSEPFLGWLCRLTDIADLEMDPKLVGGGLHQGAHGSTLHVHADHNTHPHDPSRYRRVNVLYYVNAGWDSSWGGELELYDATGSVIVQKVAPAFNRCVIMEVHDTAFHGYQPLHIPSSVTRKMLASYFYSSAPAKLQSVKSHPTIFGDPPARSALEKLSERSRRWVLSRLSDVGGLRPRRRR